MRLRRVLFPALVALAAFRSSSQAAGGRSGATSCSLTSRFTIPEGATRRVQLGAAYLSVFAEEIKEGNDKSHFYVVASRLALAAPTESIDKREFERRLWADRIGRAQDGVLSARGYVVVDVDGTRGARIVTQAGIVGFTIANPRRHQSADVVLCLPEAERLNRRERLDGRATRTASAQK